MGMYNPNIEIWIAESHILDKNEKGECIVDIVGVT